MARLNKAFNSVNTYDDLKNEFIDSMNYLTSGFFCPENLEIAVNAITNATLEQQQKILQYTKHVDRKLSAPGTAKGNRFHKIPTLMTGILYITLFPEQISDLSFDELTVLSRYSIVEPITFYETAVDYFGKDLLSVVSQKHFDFMYQSTFIELAGSKIREGQKNKDVTEYIKNTSIEELLKDSIEWEEKTLKEVGMWL